VISAVLPCGMDRAAIVRHPAVKAALPVGSRRRALAAKLAKRVRPGPPPTSNRPKAKVAAPRKTATKTAAKRAGEAPKGLRAEEAKLRAKWTASPETLGRYLVSGVQDPRINVQSVLARHVLLRTLFGSEFDTLMHEELARAVELTDAVRTRAAELGVKLSLAVTPEHEKDVDRVMEVIADRVGEFGERWRDALADRQASKISVLEYACGSANDYRTFADYGIARFLDYTGVDITETNIRNARQMFPDVNFRAGSVLSLPEADDSVDFVIGFDIMEHLSLKAMDHAMDEAIRICRRGLHFAYFMMEEIPDHVEHPVRNYHRNQISAPRTREQLADRFDTVNLINIPDLLREEYDCPHGLAHRYSLTVEGPKPLPSSAGTATP
jgi:ubiquinone/menaquinone biosynthesis C-methylase UbiE